MVMAFETKWGFVVYITTLTCNNTWYTKGNWKQWKRKLEMENGNGKREWSIFDANECYGKTFD